jgi:S-formylglutathione hydrolase FrmB
MNKKFGKPNLPTHSYAECQDMINYVSGSYFFSSRSPIRISRILSNGDSFGFYTNWVIAGDAVPQNWKAYHMEQLVPWIDLNLRTVAKKEGRAIGGLSMEGFGAIHYIERYSESFVYGASFSGAVDLLDPEIQKRILALPGPEKSLIGLFGFPNASRSSNGWIAEDTVTHTNNYTIYYENAERKNVEGKKVERKRAKN